MWPDLLLTEVCCTISQAAPRDFWILAFQAEQSSQWNVGDIAWPGGE